MRLERILSLVYSSPWAILPARHQAIRAALDAYLVKGAFFDPDDDYSEPVPAFEVVGSVAIVPIEGVILGKCSTMEAACGAFSLDTFKQTLKALAARDDIKTVLLNINSGGGGVSGLPEAGKAIKTLGTVKDVVAYSDSCCASAAYWLASNADSIFLSESAQMGNIGVYNAFLDQSVSYAQDGLKVELFKGGNSPFKAMKFPGTSLTDEQKAYMQEEVDKIYAQFVSLVAANRPKVKPDAFNGKIFDGPDSVSMGIADGVINDLDSLISYLNK